MNIRIVSGILIEKDGAFLFGKKRKDVGPYPNTWVMIGGGIRMDRESIIEGALREVEEECGLKISNLERLSFDEDYEPDKNGEMTHYLFIVFTAKYISGTPKAGDDVVELKWIKKNELKKYPLSRPSIKLFKELNWI